MCNLSPPLKGPPRTVSTRFRQLFFHFFNGSIASLISLAHHLDSREATPSVNSFAKIEGVTSQVNYLFFSPLCLSEMIFFLGVC